VAQVVAAQAHRVVAPAHLKAVHAALDDQRDVAVPAADLGAGEGDQHGALGAVADPALLAVEPPRAVRLADRARLEVVGVRTRLWLGEREPRQPAPRGQVRQQPGLLLVCAEQGDALVADRLVDAEHDRERRVGLGERLEDAAVAGLGEPLAAVLLGHVEAAEAALAEVADQLVADPAALLNRARVDHVVRVVAQPADQLAHLALLGLVGPWVREHEPFVDLAQEERLGERGDALDRRSGLAGGRGLHRRHPRSAPVAGRAARARQRGPCPRAAAPPARGSWRRAAAPPPSRRGRRARRGRRSRRSGSGRPARR
jgi:hypothetical protein